MTRLLRLLGSLQIAVPLLIAIAAVLAWGTIYETRFGTAAVQRFIYHSWWFQGLLTFLALNLAAAALGRSPWKRQHLPFVLAHLGIILILLGGILGSRFGIEGQLIIPEGSAERTLQLPGNVLVVHQPNPGLQQIFPTDFESQAWIHEPRTTFPVTIDGRDIRMTVDRYYPDAVTEEEITDDGTEDNPGVHLLVWDRDQQDAVWLLARDPERFGTRWGEAHLVFLEPSTQEQMDQLLRPSSSVEHPRGIVTLRFEGAGGAIDVPVPEEMNRPAEIAGTPYRMTFKDYFPDFAITEQGLRSRSNQPNNPAVAFTLTGPEGIDAFLLFALHPEISALHGWEHKVRVQAVYRHPAGETLPPNAVAFLRAPSGLPAASRDAAQAGSLAAVLTGSAGERQTIDRIELGNRYTHPWLGSEFEVAAYAQRAKVTQRITNRSDEVKAEFLHIVAREGDRTAEAWVGLHGSVPLALGKEPVVVEYRPAQRELPFTIKLMDFRKIDYPGTQMASAFEADVELTDPQRGIILMRKISMNNPLRHRGFSFYQSSYVPGPTETTVLSVRNDPGTPFVYAGFVIVVLGVVSMFVLRSPPSEVVDQPNRKRVRTRSRSP